MDFLASPSEQRRVAQKLQHLTNDLAHSTTAPSKGMQFAMSTRQIASSEHVRVGCTRRGSYSAKGRVSAF